MAQAGTTVERIYNNGQKTVYDKVASVAGGPIDTPLSVAATGKTAAVFPLQFKPQFKLSAQKGVALRTQGKSHKPRQAGDNFVRWVNYRINGVLGNPGLLEDLRKMLAKGFTHFRFDNVQNSERTADDGYFKRGIYSDLGTNDSNHNHDSSLTLVTSLNDLYIMMYPRIPILNTGQENSYTELINSNYEFYWFNVDGNNAATWANIPSDRKSQTFYSYYSQSNTTMNAIFSGAGGGQPGADALNQHLFAKRRVFHVMIFQMIRQLNPGARSPKITNGDELWLKDPKVNGTINIGTELSLINYKNWSLNDFKAIDNYSSNYANGSSATNLPGGSGIPGMTLNLSGHVYDFYDYFSSYYYYFNFHIKTSDYSELMSTTDPAKKTSEYWRSKFFPDRTAPYWAAVAWVIRRRFFQLLKEQEGKNYLDKPQFDMWEMMLEGNQTYIVPDDMDELDAYSNDHGTAFMPFVETGLAGEGLEGHQKMLIMRELVFIRVWTARMLYDGYFQWWEGRPTGFSGLGVSFAEGKYKYFSPCVTEEDQEAFDEIEQYNECFGASSQKIVEAKLRFSVNGGAMSSDYNNVDPPKAAFNREGGNWKFLPMILRRRTADNQKEVIYAGGWFRKNETVTVQFWDDVNSVWREVKFKGYMPSLYFLDRTTGTLTTGGTYDSSVYAQYNNQQPL